MKDIQIKNRFLELRAAGQSYADIAMELKVSKQTLINWSRDLKTELANLKTIQKDELLGRLKITTESRLELLGMMLEKLRGELVKRDFSDLPTDKLLEQIAKTSALIGCESAQLNFSEMTSSDLDLLMCPMNLREERWPA